MELLGYIIFSFAGALLCGVIALALNRWVPGWSLTRRTLIAAIASVFPASSIAGFLLVRDPQVLFSMSPDEFLIPFTFQIIMILVISLPIAWLVARRRSSRDIPTDIFN
jgi:membrane protein implicated in regulation of membrane protease activity